MVIASVDSAVTEHKDVLGRLKGLNATSPVSAVLPITREAANTLESLINSYRFTAISATVAIDQRNLLMAAASKVFKALSDTMLDKNNLLTEKAKTANRVALGEAAATFLELENFFKEMEPLKKESEDAINQYRATLN